MKIAKTAPLLADLIRERSPMATIYCLVVIFDLVIVIKYVKKRSRPPSFIRARFGQFVARIKITERAMTFVLV